MKIEKKEKQSSILSPKEKLWEIIRTKNGLPELNQESLDNITAANEILKTNSLVLYMNHTSFADAQIGAALALARFPNAKRFLAPAGMKHYDIVRDPINALALRSLKLLNMHLMPVVQASDIKSYSPKKRAKLIERLKQKTVRFLNKPGSVYAITPEGTRNKETGQLTKGKGLAELGKYSKKELYFMPISVLYPKFTDKPQIVIGKPIALSSIQDHADKSHRVLKEQNPKSSQFTTDVLMLELAKLLPLGFRGYYQD